MEWSLHNIIWDSHTGLEVENVQPGLGMEITCGNLRFGNHRLYTKITLGLLRMEWNQIALT